MQTIVLITRENSERVTHVSVFLCGNYSEANHFCHFVKRLSLAGEDKLIARQITVNAEYPLDKYQPPVFDDFLKTDDRSIQRFLREVDASTLAIALKDAKKEMKDVFIRNMSKRAAMMLEEDMENMGPVLELDIENARQLILDIYADLPREKYNRFDDQWTKYKNDKENNTKNRAGVDDRDHIVLVFRGVGTVAEFVSVYQFDEYNKADNFCHHLNNLKPDKGSFFYAKHADQMVEYETTKPLLASFDQIFEYSRVHSEFNGSTIMREALKKVSSNTILHALKDVDKRSRMIIMQCLPVKTTDEINECIEHSDYTDHFCFSDSRKAQQEIINAVNKAYSDFKKGKLSPSIMMN
jgi:hypothetical protein